MMTRILPFVVLFVVLVAACSTAETQSLGLAPHGSTSSASSTAASSGTGGAVASSTSSASTAAGTGGTLGEGGSGGGGGSSPCADAGANDPYPMGPYGLATGSTIGDLEFKGFADPKVDSSTIESFTLGDFYNPKGNETFSACSPLMGPKPKALLVALLAVWAGPANSEAKSVLPAKYVHYKPLGAEFIGVLVEGPTPGVPPTPANLTNWAKAYGVNYPSAIEPALSLNGAVMNFPTNIIIDTATMKVVGSVDGVPADNDPIWTALDGIVGG